MKTIRHQEKSCLEKARLVNAFLIQCIFVIFNQRQGCTVGVDTLGRCDYKHKERTVSQLCLCYSRDVFTTTKKGGGGWGQAAQWLARWIPDQTVKV